MSFDTSCVYGRGFKVFESYVEPLLKNEKILAFLKKHINSANDKEKDVIGILFELESSIKEEYKPEHSMSQNVNYFNLEDVDFEDYLEGIQALDDINAEFSGDNEKFFTIIANIISRETGLSIGYFAGTESPTGAILYVESYPWNLNEKEKELKTKEDFDNIMKKYLCELIGNPLETEKYNHIDYYKIEYWG